MADDTDNAPMFSIQRLYLKDLSLEQPNSPQILLEQGQPQVEINLGLGAEVVAESTYEVTVTATVTATVNAKPISAIMTRTVSAAGMDWGLLAAAGVLTIIPGALVIWFVRNYIARGFALGRV